MTVTELIRDYVPKLSEFFSQQIQMEWPLDEYMRSERRDRERGLAGLYQWKKGGGMENLGLVGQTLTRVEAHAEFEGK